MAHITLYFVATVLECQKCHNFIKMVHLRKDSLVHMGWSGHCQGKAIMRCCFIISWVTLSVKGHGGDGVSRGGRCSLFLPMRCFTDAMFSNS